jgi:HAD superfamily hydrolase (TIGR01509 family)
MLLQAVLFDMDGVVVDSEEFILEAATEMFREKGVTVQPDDFKPFVGTGENRYLGGVAEKYGLTLEIDGAKRRTYEIFGRIIKGTLRPLPGTVDYIALCRRRGLKIALASSADKTKVDASLREIGLSDSTFDVILNGLDVERRKPDPEIFRTAAERLGVDPAHCLVVEDSPSGLAAAKGAGARCLILTTTFPASTFVAPDWVAADLSVAPPGALAW